MALRHFPNHDRVHEAINEFEDWFATQGPDNRGHTSAPTVDAAASDLVSGAAISASSSAVLVPASSPLHYFLKIDGVTGDSTVKGFEGWFSVDGFDLGVTNASSTSAGGGAGAGKATFSPLTVDIHSLAGLAPLFADAVTGHVIKSVELVGAETLKGQSLNVYDLKLSDVRVSSFGDDPGTKGVETELAFKFGQISLTDRPPTANGAPGAPQTFNFDTLKNTAALAASDVVAGAGSAPSAVMVPDSSPLHYFLKIDGVTGDSTVKGFEGWFSVDGFDLGVTTPASFSAGGGAGVGKASFSPLTVDIHSLAGLAPLFADAVTGHVIKSVELVGAETLKGQSLNVYDVKLSDVRLISFGDDPGQKGVETELAFKFGQISLTDRPPSANGAPGTPQTVSFDVLKNATDAVAASDLVSGAVSASSSAVLVPASSPLHYFLKIDGVTGDSTVKGFEGWFSVDGFDLGVTNASSASAGGGAGAGKASFSPLTVDIHSLAGLAPLFSDAVTGHVIKSVELVGAETLKGQSLNVYDVKLSDVHVTSFGDDPGTQGVETALAFDFRQISLTDRPPSANGAPSTPQSVSFDVLKNATDAVAASDLVSGAAVSASGSAQPTAVLVPASSPLHYFLKIDGVTGDSTVKGFEGWFSVDGFDLGVKNAASTSAGGGAGAGKASFSPLTVDIHSLAGLAPLFADAVTGHVIKSVELVGAETLKGQSLNVYDVKLSDVQVTSFADDPGTQGVETALAFDFRQISLTDRPPTANGAPGTPQTASFDVLKNATDVVAASDIVASDVGSAAGVSAPSAVMVPASSPLHYFLKIDGVTGDSTVKGFKGWFSVDGFDLGVQSPSSVSAGGGAGAGKASFSPLTVDIHSLAGLAPLFADAVNGHVLKSVELVGAETLKGQNLKVYDVKLSDVQITSFGDDPGTQGVETALAFDFGKISLTDRPPTARGAAGAPQTVSFDVLKNTTALAASDVVSSAVSAAGSAQPNATLVPASSPLQYFLKVDGVTGDSTVKGFEGWFSVDGFDLGVTTPSSTSAGGGAGAGKPTFSPLTVDIHSLAGLATLFGDAVTGHVLKSVELVGAETLKGQSLNVYDVKLSDVQVTSFGDDPGQKGVETELGFSFGQISVTDRLPTARGAPGTPQTFSFDLLKNATTGLAASDLVFDPLLNGGALNPLTLMAAASIETTGSQSLLSQPTLTAHS